jgi:hypothetical protein
MLLLLYHMSPRAQMILCNSDWHDGIRWRTHAEAHVIDRDHNKASLMKGLKPLLNEQDNLTGMLFTTYSKCYDVGRRLKVNVRAQQHVRAGMAIIPYS